MQDKFRKALREDYLKYAFECLANYDYFGRRYKAIEDNINEMDKLKEGIAAEIKAINDSEARYTPENREKIKALSHDSDMYQKRIEGVSDSFKNLFNLAVQLREKGGTYLEQADNFLTFKMRTPEEIAADAKKSNDDKPAK